ncbi:ABC transporter ATP-binding protein [Nitrincola tapanii]|uniref:ABC transporter ATP-binding protein n=1 Tax=Nitrincola tapanii TaxID=1708751 RepID=A0A5A9W2S6_9GAMM|nr:ABC transporter ATP-binding protein [Nitrincola tapanii]KAA0874405.1 ABC transporter ATP-binding protein [Nitrincola tapanii]
MNRESEVVISVNNISKSYQLYASPYDRLKESLSLSNKKYHRIHKALDDISFKVYKGQTVGIIGKNGCGKSTILKIIAKVVRPSSGSIQVKGRVSAILELGAGLNQELSGLKNIHLFNTINGIKKADKDDVVKKVVEFSDLGKYIDQPVKSYSSGMKARLAFALAINFDPDILIVDEALSVGDISFRRKCFAKIEALKQKGTTILFVSHSESSIISLCDRAIWLSNGQYVLDGQPKEVVGLYSKHINDKDLCCEKMNKLYKALFSNVKDQKNEALNVKAPGYYDKKLKPKSTISYQNIGAEIYDLQVRDHSGRVVNILKSGLGYLIEYKVKFEGHVEKARFATQIRDEKGHSLAGYVTPATTEFLEIDPKIEYLIQFEFENLFNTEMIFISAGVRSIVDDQLVFLHRVLDGYVCKTSYQSVNNTGLTSLFKKANIKEIQKDNA